MTLTPQQLAARAVQEAQDALNSLSVDDDEDEDGDNTHSKKKKKSRLKKSHGAGNYKEYRNKTFIKGASRRDKNRKEDDEDEQ